MSILIQNVTAVLLDESRTVLPNAFVAVEGSQISYVGTKRPAGPPSRPLSPCRTAPSWPSPGRGPGRACWRPCGGSPPCRWPI